MIRRRTQPNDPANPIPRISAARGGACSVSHIAQDSSVGDAFEVAARFAALAMDSRHLSETETAELDAALSNVSDPRVQAVALGALIRGTDRGHAVRAWTNAAQSSVIAVRRRAAELAPQLGALKPEPLIALIADPDGLVAEAACWAGGEIAWEGASRALMVSALIGAASHDDPLVRESAVAALGAIGDGAGLDAILAACTDRPTVRRRAVLALAPFEGPAVEAALLAAGQDSDWQTRQAAEDLMR